MPIMMIYIYIYKRERTTKQVVQIMPKFSTCTHILFFIYLMGLFVTLDPSLTAEHLHDFTKHSTSDMNTLGSPYDFGHPTPTHTRC